MLRKYHKILQFTVLIKYYLKKTNLKFPSKAELYKT